MTPAQTHSAPRPATIRGRIAQFFNSRPDLLFWLCFLTLNGLLFVPLVVAGMESAGASSAVGGGSWGLLAASLVDFGPIHLSAELTLLAGIWLLLARRNRLRGLFGLLLALVYVGILLYHLYEAVMQAVYQMEPVFYSQYRFIVDGIGFVLEHANFPVAVYVAAVLGMALFGGLLVGLVGGMGRGIRLGLSRWSRLGMAGAVLLVLISVGWWGTSDHTLARPDAPISSITVKVWKNVAASRQLQQQVVQLTESQAVVDAYDFSDLWLGKRPNIMLIFIESYGSVLYKRPDYAAAYTELLTELETTLADAGWHSTSALSESPTWGGGSWMAYTSALFGVRIDEHPQYLALLDRFDEETFPSFGAFLKAQGYRYTWLSTVSKELKDDEWSRYKHVYGVDDWLRYRDLRFDGPRYGWGPAPPDQYSLHAVRERLHAQPDPYLLFFITQNSHYPWVPLPEMTDDWRTLDLPGPDPVVGDQDEIAHHIRRQNYMNAVEYELRMLTDLILTETDEETIYVLVGDHQPPRVSRKDDGWDTPVHIISRDGAFVAQFADYGFGPGLLVDGTPPDLGDDPELALLQLLNREPTLRHEALYSLLMRTLLARYGLPPANLTQNLPAFLPNGVQLEPSPAAVGESPAAP